MKASLCIAVAAAITASKARGSTAPAQGNSGDVSLFGSNSSNKSGKISSKAAKNSKPAVSKSAKGDPEAKAAKSAGVHLFAKSGKGELKAKTAKNEGTGFHLFPKSGKSKTH